LSWSLGGPPSVDAGAAATVDEGSLFTRVGHITDLGSTAWTALVNYGEGDPAEAVAVASDGSFTLAHRYRDSGTPLVSVTVTDETGQSGSTGFGLTVSNVAPTATFVPPPVSEGSPIALSLTDPVDPSTSDTTAGFTYAFDCGAGFGAFSASSTAECPTTDNESRTVRAEIRDKDGGTTDYQRTVTVANVAPTATFVPPSVVSEGSPIALSLTDPLDASTADTTAGFTYAFDCGAGFGAFSASPTAACPTTDNGSRTVRGEIRDKDGGVSVYQAVAGVTNVAPTLGVATGPSGPLAANSAATVGVPFTDAGSSDTHTAVLMWDDGTSSAGTVSESAGRGTVSATHTFGAPGVYSVGISVTDDDGGVSSTTFDYVVVYDATGSFVTGGGWISSPAGAYSPNPGLTGRASFGFVSKYQKGATVPTGNTAFQFDAAGLDFSSTSYQWLVVSGARAQYKGSGTLNGEAGYDFLLTATDGDVSGGGGVDKFRIKITRSSTGETVYDNVRGASGDIDAASPQAIGGGSIVIHK
ncbi:MAG: PKD domain-containing protein, partial [Mycobacteriales bacterium]